MYGCLTSIAALGVNCAQHRTDLNFRLNSEREKLKSDSLETSGVTAQSCSSTSMLGSYDVVGGGKGSTMSCGSEPRSHACPQGLRSARNEVS